MNNHKRWFEKMTGLQVLKNILYYTVMMTTAFYIHSPENEGLIFTYVLPAVSFLLDGLAAGWLHALSGLYFFGIVYIGM